MSLTFAFWADAGMTVPNTAGATLVDGGSPTDRILYFGSPVAGKTLQAASAPGTDPVQVEVNDTNGASGAPASAVRLALTAGGLDTATPGAALSLGTSITSGTAIAVFVRTTQGALAVGSYADLQLRTVAVVES